MSWPLCSNFHGTHYAENARYHLSRASRAYLVGKLEKNQGAGRCHFWRNALTLKLLFVEVAVMFGAKEAQRHRGNLRQNVDHTMLCIQFQKLS